MPATLKLPIYVALGRSEPREVGVVEVPLQVTPGDGGSVDIGTGDMRTVLIKALRELADGLEST
jgi:hypothetical protein